MSNDYNMYGQITWHGKFIAVSKDHNEQDKQDEQNPAIARKQAEIIEGYQKALNGIFSSAFSGKIVFKDCYYQNDIRSIKAELENININLISIPVLNAWYNPYGNTITLSMYFLNMMTKLYNFQNLARTLMCVDTIETAEFYRRVHDEQLRKQRLSDFKKLLSEVPEYKFESGKNETHLLWFNWDDFCSIDADSYVIYGVALVHRHEMAHWHLRRFKENVRSGFMKKAEEMLFLCVREYSFYDIQGFLSGNKTALKNWAEEICADYLSIDMSLGLKTREEGEDKKIFLAAAYYFVTLRVNELIQNDRLHNDRGLHLNASHPPAAIRELAVLHWLSKDADMSFEQYLFTMVGAWIYVSSIFDTTIVDMLEEK